MPQANYIFACLVVAFLIFITSRGELPKYANVFVGPGGSAGTTTPTKTAAATETAAAPVKDPTTAKLESIDQGVKNGLELQRRIGTPSALLDNVLSGIFK